MLRFLRQAEKYVSVEKQIEKTKARYYDALEATDFAWHEAKNNPTPFIRYMLQVILACYTEFEERVGLVTAGNAGSSAYDIARKYAGKKRQVHRGAGVCGSPEYRAVVRACRAEKIVRRRRYRKTRRGKRHILCP